MLRVFWDAGGYTHPTVGWYWTDAEVEWAIAAGYQPVSLGSRILRTVTAPLATLVIIAAVGESNEF